jgi:hypothetical protein
MLTRHSAAYSGNLPHVDINARVNDWTTALTLTGNRHTEIITFLQANGGIE